MDNETLKKSRTRNLFITNFFPIACAIIAIIAGIIVGVFALKNAYKELDTEHHEHLISLVWSTDRNLDNLLQYNKKALREEVIKNANATDNELIYNLVNGSIFDDEKIDAVVTLSNMQLLNSSDESIDSLIFYEDYSTNKPILCLDNNGKNYLGIIEHTATSGVDIAALMQLDHFFDKFVGNELTDYYWLALYDIKNGLCIQDDATQPYVKDISYEDALGRGDGITVLAQSEKQGKILSDEYNFQSDSTSSTHFIITALPTSINDNGYFTVGLSVPTEHYESILNRIFWRTAICGALILFGLFILFLLSRRHHITNEAMRADIKLLRQKNETMKALLDTTQQISHQQRLVTIGTIASNVNHEFSNLLTPIMGYSVLAMEKVSDNEDAMTYLEKIYEASSIAKGLVARLLKLSRKNSNAEHTMLVPDIIINNVEKIIIPSLPKNVTIVKQLSCPQQCLYASETQIEQVLINIILNAFQAMADTGGTLTLYTSCNDEYVEFRIRDTGPGMSKDVLARVFEPFFTTKSESVGTGLGLTIVKQIVEDHHGKIEVTSDYGIGTEFVIRLPV